ncbi:DinB superfamily protein [Streptomyces sp. DfronAA-171]|nr:DinB superfamily protein [Streptomyces sp. DfronAA-171]
MTAVQEPGQDAEALRDLALRSLSAARARTALLTDAVDEPDLVAQHSPLMSPLVWDLAHIGNQEELWLLRAVAGRDAMRPDIDPLYDAFEHPRAERPSLPLLPPAEARRYAAEVRGRVFDLLEGARFGGGDFGAGLDGGGFRLRHGGPARAAARRDDAHHAPAPLGPPGAPGARPRPGGRERRIRRSPRPGR